MSEEVNSCRQCGTVDPVGGLHQKTLLSGKTVNTYLCCQLCCISHSATHNYISAVANFIRKDIQSLKDPNYGRVKLGLDEPRPDAVVVGKLSEPLTEDHLLDFGVWPTCRSAAVEIAMLNGMVLRWQISDKSFPPHLLSRGMTVLDALSKLAGECGGVLQWSEGNKYDVRQTYG